MVSLAWKLFSHVSRELTIVVNNDHYILLDDIHGRLLDVCTSVAGVFPGLCSSLGPREIIGAC